MQKSSHKRPPSHATYSNIEFDPEFNASPAKRKIGYLKTHKCASTSIQNILLRYAIKNELNVVLPPKGGNILGYEKIFNRDIIKSPFWGKAPISYDMFLCHARWNQSEISYVLNETSKNDVFYFTFVRDPVDLFRSSWDYNAFDLEFGRLNEFTTNKVVSQLKNKSESIWSKQFGYNCGGWNQMMYDFGLECKDMNDVKKIEMKIEEIDKNFDLVLLADKQYFEDSIILLKNSIHWDYKDMVNFKLNARRPTDRTKLSYEERIILKGKNK